MMAELLNRIVDPSHPDRDLLIDELSDMIVSGKLDRIDREFIVAKLIELLPQESNDAVSESIFNLFGNVYEDSDSQEKIVDASIALLDRMSPGCLVHAISIIGRSERADKNALLERFVNSSNPIVRAIADEVLTGK